MTRDYDPTPKLKAELNDVLIALRQAGLAYDMKRKIILVSSERRFTPWGKGALVRSLREVIKV